MAKRANPTTVVQVPRGWGIFAGSFALLFWVASVGWPLGALAYRGWIETGALSGAQSIWFDEDILATLRFTAAQASLSTLISSLVGLGAGLALGARIDPRGRGWTRAALLSLLIPFGIPSLVVAVALLAWFGRDGWLAQMGIGSLSVSLAYTPSAVVLAHVLLNIPWVTWVVAQARARVPQAHHEIARSLGAGAGSRFRFVIWPAVQVAFGFATVQVFTLCAMSFALVMILGGGPPVETLETAIYTRVRFGSLDLPGALACAFWQLALTGVPWLIALVVLRRDHQASIFGEASPSFAFDAKRLIGPKTALLCALAWLPYLTVFTRRTPRALATSFAEWVDPARTSVAISLGVAIGVVGLAGGSVIGVRFVRSRGGWAFAALAELAIGSVSGISVLVLGLGFWLAYGRFVDPFAGSRLAISVIQITLFFPLAYRTLAPMGDQIRVPEIEIARSLGAGPFRALWWVEGARFARVLVSIGAIAAVGSLGEIAAISFFGGTDFTPLPLLITRWMGQYRFEDAQAVSALLLLLTAGTLVLFNYLGTLKSSPDGRGTEASDG